MNLFEPANFVAFGFAHPLFLVLTLTVGISVGTVAVAGDVETGRSEMLYTRPIPRTAILDVGLPVLARIAVQYVPLAAFLGAVESLDISDALVLLTGAALLVVTARYRLERRDLV